jgi:hypothetical protein
MATSILDRIRTALKRPSPTPAQLAEALKDARRAEADSKAAVERQVAAVAAGFLDPDAARATARARLADLRAEAEDAALIVKETERRHAAALEAEEQERRLGLYTSAKTEAEVAAADLEKAYPRLAKDLVALVGRLARAQAAVAQVNAELPSGVEPLNDPELVARSAPGSFREIVSDEWVEAWGRIDSDEPVPEQFQGQIYAVGTEGWGKRGHYVGGALSQGEPDALYRRRRFRKITFREATNGNWPAPLAASLHLPAIRGDGALWGDERQRPPLQALLNSRGGADPAAVLSQLAALDAAATERPVPVVRPLKTEWAGHVDVVPLPVDETPRDTVSRREKSGGTWMGVGSTPFLPGRISGR